MIYLEQLMIFLDNIIATISNPSNDKRDKRHSIHSQYFSHYRMENFLFLFKHNTKTEECAAQGKNEG